MGIPARYLQALLEQLSDKTKESMDMAGFLQMSDKIDSEHVSGRYLKENLYDKVRQGEKEIQVRRVKLDAIAGFLGQRSFSEFMRMVDLPVPESLLHCLGNWYSYVRSNSGNRELLRAPVCIAREGNEVRMILKGRERTFGGELMERSGNAYAWLDTGAGKALSMVLKVGISRQPQVLQGVFAGISSNGDPICGRELLVRQQVENISELCWERLAMDEPGVDPRILQYFHEYEKNCIKINRVSNFDLDDLGDASA